MWTLNLGITGSGKNMKELWGEKLLFYSLFFIAKDFVILCWRANLTTQIDQQYKFAYIACILNAIEKDYHKDNVILSKEMYINSNLK